MSKPDRVFIELLSVTARLSGFRSVLAEAVALAGESGANRGRQSYERGWSVNPVPVSCSLSTRMRISIAALDLARRY